MNKRKSKKPFERKPSRGPSKVSFSYEKKLSKRDGQLSWLVIERPTGSIVASRVREEIAQDTQDEIISEKREPIMSNITTMSNLFEISQAEAQNLENSYQNTDLAIYTRSPGEARFSLANSDETASVITNSIAEEIEVKYYLPLQNIWGVEVLDVRIKRADFPDSVESSIFKRKKSKRNKAEYWK